MSKPSNRIHVKSVIEFLVAIIAATIFTFASGEPLSRTSKGLALTGAHVIGHGPAVLIIRDGRIEAISDNTAGENLEVIDLDGRYIVPAFIDSHVHLAIGYTAAQLTHGGLAAAVDLSAPLSYLAGNYNRQLIAV